MSLIFFLYYLPSILTFGINRHTRSSKGLKTFGGVPPLPVWRPNLRFSASCTTEKEVECILVVYTVYTMESDDGEQITKNVPLRIRQMYILNNLIEYISIFHNQLYMTTVLAGKCPKEHATHLCFYFRKPFYFFLAALHPSPIMASNHIYFTGHITPCSDFLLLNICILIMRHTR